MSKKSKKIVQLLIIAGVIIFLIVYKIGWLDKSFKQENGVARRNSKLPVSAFVAEITTMDNTIKSAGTLVAEEEVTITTEVSGIVSSTHFKDGMNVEKGDLLIKINDDELRAQLEKAEHQRTLVQQSLERQEVLLKKDAISHEAFDKVKTDLLVLDSEVQLLNVKLSKTAIRAPFSGRVGFREVSQGAFLQPGATITKLVKTTPLRIEFAVPERYQSENLVGREIDFIVAGFEDVFKAEIYAVEPRIDERTRSLVLRAKYANENEKLLPGMFAHITVPIQRLTNIIQVPAHAIIPELNGESVFVYKSGKAFKQSVVTGIRNENLIAVTEGLNNGDTIITSGILQLRHSMPVTIE